MKRILIPLFAALLASACMPRLYKPQVTVPDAYIYAQSPTADTSRLGAEWWNLLGDTTLDTLVTYALDNNRDVMAALSRVEQARLNLKVVRTQYLPQVGVGVTAEAEYTPQTGIVQSYAIQPTLAWEVSLFGALRHAKDAARAQIAASQWALQGMRLSLAAEVATTYFTLLEYRRDLEISRRTLTLRRESAALIDSMFRYGMSDGVALEQARSLAYTAAANVPLYERAVEQTWLSLCVLLGQNPSPADLDSEGISLTTDRLPEQIPEGLPSELLERRPDIREAYYAMQQSAAQAGMARAARFPSISLTGKGGIVSSSIKSLTSANPWAWDAAGSIVEPLFAFGKLRRGEQAAVEAYKQAALGYEQTALAAFGDVEAALTAVQTYREQTLRYGQLVSANDRIASMTQALYRSGMADYLNVIDAQRELYASQMQYANLAAQQYISYINLCKALGGGW